jgi:acyl dehydratase
MVAGGGRSSVWTSLFGTRMAHPSTTSSQAAKATADGTTFENADAHLPWFDR